MYFRIPKDYIFSMEEKYDFDFLSDGYRSSNLEIDYEFNDEYAEADEEYFESVTK